MSKYFEVIGKFEGDLEVLFGSFDRLDCKYEIEAEKTSWKDQGYKGIKIVSRLTDEKPDPTVYENLADEKEVMQIVNDLNEGDLNSYIEDGLITKAGNQFFINDSQLLTDIKKGKKMNMKKIDGIWHICRDGWVFETATKSEVISHLFNSMPIESFEKCLKRELKFNIKGMK